MQERFTMEQALRWGADVRRLARESSEREDAMFAIADYLQAALVRGESAFPVCASVRSWETSDAPFETGPAPYAVFSASDPEKLAALAEWSEAEPVDARSALGFVLNLTEGEPVVVLAWLYEELPRDLEDVFETLALNAHAALDAAPLSQTSAA